MKKFSKKSKMSDSFAMALIRTNERTKRNETTKRQRKEGDVGRRMEWKEDA